MTSLNLLTLPHWPCAYRSPQGNGRIRAFPSDFIVEEMLSFKPSGEGEHIFLQIQKINQNTEYVARQLARFANVRQRDIGYAGMKDRYAKTTQWFSVWLPKGEIPIWSDFCIEGVQVLSVTRHARKLKRGALACNRFVLTIREWSGDITQTLETLQALKAHGVPNYYGEQRFGREGQNVRKALAMFEGEKVPREQRSIYLSAARAFLFNCILAQRIENGSWATGLAGDVLMLEGSQSVFACDDIDDALAQRLANYTLHPTGALYGKGDLLTQSVALQLEQNVFDAYAPLTQGLQTFGLESARRALRVNVQALTWEYDNAQATLVLTFSLPAGSYATAVLRELIAYSS